MISKVAVMSSGRMNHEGNSGITGTGSMNG